MCAAPSLRSVRHLRPGWRTKTELAPWPPPLHASAGFRPDRLALCVWRISRAADGDDVERRAEADRHKRAVAVGEAR